MSSVIRLPFTVAVFIGTIGAAFGQFRSPSYSGGSCSVSGGSPGGPYLLTSGAWGGGGTGVSVTCGGAITATFTWNTSGSPAPAQAVVVQTCKASSYAYSGSSSADNGLGDPDNSSSTTSPPETTDVSGVYSGTQLWQHYSVVSVGTGGVVTLTCTPTAGGYGTPANGAVWYTATVQPLGIVFRDSNGTGPTNNRKYIMGQNVLAQLSGGLTNSSPGLAWTASGCTPFLSYVRSQASATLNLLPSPYNTVTFSGYFATPGSPSLNCTGTATLPAGSKPATGLPISATQSFTITAPSFTQDKATVGTQGGYPTASPSQLLCFGVSYNNPDLGGQASPCGVYFAANLGSPGGQFYYVQLVNVARSRSGPGGSQIAGMVGTNPPWYTSGLNTIFPDDPTPSESNVLPYFNSAGLHYADDSPGQAFTGPTTSWTSYSINGESLQTYLMYCPPGTASMDVPYEMGPWSWSCSGSYASNVWTAADSAMSASAAIKYPGHPQWTKVVNGGMMWH